MDPCIGHFAFRHLYVPRAVPRDVQHDGRRAVMLLGPSQDMPRHFAVRNAGRRLLGHGQCVRGAHCQDGRSFTGCVGGWAMSRSTEMAMVW